MSTANKLAIFSVYLISAVYAERCHIDGKIIYCANGCCSHYYNNYETECCSSKSGNDTALIVVGVCLGIAMKIGLVCCCRLISRPSYPGAVLYSTTGSTTTISMTTLGQNGPQPSAPILISTVPDGQTPLVVHYNQPDPPQLIPETRSPYPARGVENAGFDDDPLLLAEDGEQPTGFTPPCPKMSLMEFPTIMDKPPPYSELE